MYSDKRILIQAKVTQRKFTDSSNHGDLTSRLLLSNDLNFFLIFLCATIRYPSHRFVIPVTVTPVANSIPLSHIRYPVKAIKFGCFYCTDWQQATDSTRTYGSSSHSRFTKRIESTSRVQNPGYTLEELLYVTENFASSFSARGLSFWNNTSPWRSPAAWLHRLLIYLGITWSLCASWRGDESSCSSIPSIRHCNGRWWGRKKFPVPGLFLKLLWEIGSPLPRWLRLKQAFLGSRKMPIAHSRDAMLHGDGWHTRYED